MKIYELDSLGFKGYKLGILEDDVTFFGTTGRELKQPVDSFGYKVVNMESSTQSHTQRVHKIVAKVCHPNLQNLNVVLHLDNNKLNCHPDNLKWGTYAENNKHCQEQKRNPGNTKKLQEVLIIQESILIGGTYLEIIQRCADKGVKLSKGTLTKYKKEMASECND